VSPAATTPVRAVTGDSVRCGRWRADVADIYDQGASAYEALWSPVILPPAAVLVRSLGLCGRCVIADIGAGTGALLGPIGSVAPAARVVALDASTRMLRIALPLADGTADAVILAYVLFHLADPARAAAEAARVVRPGGRAGIITWAWERHARTSAPDHRYYAAVKDRKNSKRACLSEARKILRQAHHILAELGDDALAAA
jgi:ubiquinone/menaquinone biosynthesis C-methylase UbiE